MTQVWSSDDPFSDDGMVQASSYLDHIGRHIPWITDPAHGSGGTGFGYQEAGFGTASQLYSGWFNQQTPVLYGTSATPAAVSSGSIVLLTTRSMAFLRRGVLLDDVRVAISFQAQATDMSYLRSNAFTLMAGVGARVVPSANADPTLANSCRTRGGDGYWLFAAHDTTIGLGTKYELVRVNAGTVTRLAESPVGSTNFTAWGSTVVPASATYWKPMVLELHVSDEGGNVRLIAYTTVVSGSHGGVRRELFNVLDSSASRLTAAGYTGLLSSSEFILTPSPSRIGAMCFNWWEATSLDEATVHFRDEWARTKLGLGLFRNTSSSGAQAHRSGFALMSGWAGDSQTGISPGPWLTLDTANDRVTVPAASNLPAILSMRPADDARVQDRAATFRFTSTGSATATERYAGIGLRGTIAVGVTSAFDAGYIVRLYFKDDTTSTRLTLSRVVAGAETVIAQKTSPVAFALDANITIRFAIETAEVPDPVNGYAVMRTWINGSQIVLVAATVPQVGVDIAADGTVTDTTSSRVLAGLGESIYVWAPTGTRTITFDTWAQDSGAGSVVVPEDDQASIPVGGEYASTVGELTLPVSSRAVVRYVDPRIEHVMESRHRYLGRRVGYARRIWSVSATATQAEIDTLLALIELARGPEGALDWTPPGYRATPVVVHIVDESVDIDLVAPGAYALRMDLQELRLVDA